MPIVAVGVLLAVASGLLVLLTLLLPDPASPSSHGSVTRVVPRQVVGPVMSRLRIVTRRRVSTAAAGSLVVLLLGASAPGDAGSTPCLGVGGDIAPGRGIGPVQIGMLASDAEAAVHGTAVWGYGTGQIGVPLLFANTPDPAVGWGLQGYYDLHRTRAGVMEHGGLVVVELTARLFHIIPTLPPTASFSLDAVLSCATPSGLHLLSPWSTAVAQYPRAHRPMFPDGRPLLVDSENGIAFGRGTVTQGGRQEDVVFQIDVFRPHRFCESMRFVASALGQDGYTCTIDR